MLLSPAVCLLHRVGAPHGVEETKDSATLADVWLMSDAESDHGSWDDDDPRLLRRNIPVADVRGGVIARNFFSQHTLQAICAGHDPSDVARHI